jgi:hypothetical protein
VTSPRQVKIIMPYLIATVSDYWESFILVERSYRCTVIVKFGVRRAESRVGKGTVASIKVRTTVLR